MTNPAAHNVYLCLTNYVRVCSEAWFKTKLTTLRVLDWGCGKCISFYRGMGAMVTSCDVTSGAAFGQDAPIIDQRIHISRLFRTSYLLPSMMLALMSSLSFAWCSPNTFQTILPYMKFGECSVLATSTVSSFYYLSGLNG
ncbi:MAG: hypothetical protein CLLPBCKN_005910 [Chroococcidiopsis cubana SAG 39.79]|nr:hypothetical protein [Chroococcidiopsis cubana]MDZ4876490.1 hypothetical protein [Chroococcidiopsis cubana SAG 39.79]